MTVQARLCAATGLVALTVVAVACGSPVVEQAAAELAGSGPSAIVVAEAIAFEPTSLSMPAGVPLRLELRNADDGVPHDIVVRAGAEDIAKSEIVVGVAMTDVRFGPLAPGSYEYVCDVHPNMTGTLTITP